MTFKDRIKQLEKQLPVDAMIKSHEFKIYGSRDAALFYSDTLVDKITLDENVLYPLKRRSKTRVTLNEVVESGLSHVETNTDITLEKAISSVFFGDALLVIDKIDQPISIAVRKWESRSVTEPPTAPVIKGPREGFTEDFNTNVSLIKRRIKRKEFKLKTLIVGRYTKTTVAVCYIEGIADERVFDNVVKRIEQIDVDGILDSAYLEQYLVERKFSIFNQVGDTEKPDVFAAKLLEGRVGIIVEGSPIVLTVPYLILEDFQSPEDYYDVPYSASFVRVVRMFAMFVGIFMPGIYVAAQIYHIQFIPLRFLLTIAAGTKGIPLSPSLEMIFILFVFEILNEASIRMPKYVGMALSVVGALVLGETAVRAGIVSSPTILIMSLSAIAVYTVPDKRNTFSILRLVFLLLAGSLGVCGILAGGIVVIVYLCATTSYGAPVLAPFAPHVENDLSDAVLKTPLTVENERPQSLNNKNKTRLLWKER